MGSDGSPRITLAPAHKTDGVTKAKVVSFRKGKAEQTPAPVKTGRIRIRAR